MIYFLLFALLYVYLLWRLWANLRRGADIRSQVSGLTFLTVFVLLWIVSPQLSGLSRPAAAVLLLAVFAGTVLLNLYLFQRYDRWLKDREEREKQGKREEK